MGNLEGCLWLTAWWGTWEVFSLVGKEGSKLRYSKYFQGWNVENKDPFLPAVIVGSYTKAT